LAESSYKVHFSSAIFLVGTSDQSTVVALNREIFDHTPLLLNKGHTSSCSNYTMFKFELGWLLRDGFADMVKNIWINENKGSNAMERCVRGWTKNVSGAYKKDKKDLLNKLTSLDKKSGTNFTDPSRN
jgi:hypothetical protein